MCSGEGIDVCHRERARNQDPGSYQPLGIIPRVVTRHVPTGLETTPPGSTWDGGEDAKGRREDWRTGV